eukprot:g1523.t1
MLHAQRRLGARRAVVVVVAWGAALAGLAGRGAWGGQTSCRPDENRLEFSGFQSMFRFVHPSSGGLFHTPREERFKEGNFNSGSPPDKTAHFDRFFSFNYTLHDEEREQGFFRFQSRKNEFVHGWGSSYFAAHNNRWSTPALGDDDVRWSPEDKSGELHGPWGNAQPVSDAYVPIPANTNQATVKLRFWLKGKGEASVKVQGNEIWSLNNGNGACDHEWKPSDDGEHPGFCYKDVTWSTESLSSAQPCTDDPSRKCLHVQVGADVDNMNSTKGSLHVVSVES